MAVAGSEDAVRSVVMDYVEGWFEGNAGRLEDRQRGMAPALEHLGSVLVSLVPSQ